MKKDYDPMPINTDRNAQYKIQKLHEHREIIRTS
jgi:hypothetical protein